ncbi:unnamed protein product [Lactuca saligna]|uniref:DUF4283 domain-containing protein n=1 Tax=Lactuca saligna TaxID=75948 RepID=A0AA35Y850_LACSI|nr:unnamed protein product [Lactuca saligna]
MVGNESGSRSRTQVGTIVDVYIAKKLSKLGKHFAFVCFIKVLDEKLLESKIRDIWLGSYHLFASVECFQRESDHKGHSNSHAHGDQGVSKLNGLGLESYAIVVKRGKRIHKLKGPKPNVCTLSGKEICNNMSLKASVFVKLRDIMLIQNFCVLLKEEGFDDLQIKYFASDWVYLTFLFEEERVVWIQMTGLTCCAWNEDVVSKVASMWGDVCFLDDHRDAPLVIKRVCIKTSKSALIHETVIVVAQGIKYDVTVCEVSNWKPDILEEGEVGSDILDLSDEEEANDFFIDECVCDLQKDCQEGKGDEEVADSFNVDSNPNLVDKGAGFVDRKGHFFQTSGRKKKVDICFEYDEWVASIPIDASVTLPTRPERVSFFG